MTPLANALTIRELNHIALYVRNVDASVRFYGDVLALPRLPRPDFPFEGAWFALGSQELHLIKADPMRQASGNAFHFALQVEDAQAASAALLENGATNLQVPSRRPDGVWQVFLRDPDNNLIEILSATHL